MPARDYPSSLTWLQPSLWDCQHSDHLKPARKLLRNRQRVPSVTAQIVSLLCGIRATTSGLMHAKWVLYHTAISLAPDCFLTDIGNASCFWERLVSHGPPFYLAVAWDMTPHNPPSAFHSSTFQNHPPSESSLTSWTMLLQDMSSTPILLFLIIHVWIRTGQIRCEIQV